jgi:hypothetical protein
MAQLPNSPSRRVERPWLRRVGGYVPGKRRTKREPGAEGEPGFGEDEAGDPTEVDGEPGDDASPQDAAPSDAPPGDAPSGDGNPQDGDAEDGEPTDAEPSEAAPQNPQLSVPPDVEAKREADRRRREADQHRREDQHNRHLAPKAFDLDGRYLRALAARFARMVSKVAEDSADMPTQGDDEWDLEELRMRRFTGRLVSQCRMTREKRTVAVVLDTSPSCEHQARLFGSVAQVAEALGDCELYDAPNFAIGARKTTGAWEPLPELERDWHFERRVVLAFGDFDGIERICKASQVRGNKIYWFCCEERPSVMNASRDFFVKQYKGHYLPATNLDALMKAMGRVR